MASKLFISQNDWTSEETRNNEYLDVSHTDTPESSLPEIRAWPSWVKRNTVILR